MNGIQFGFGVSFVPGSDTVSEPGRNRPGVLPKAADFPPAVDDRAPDPRAAQAKIAEQDLAASVAKAQVQTSGGIDLRAWQQLGDLGGVCAPKGSEWGPNIPPYDPRLGPQISNDMWTEEMLTAIAVPNDLVKNMKDPAAFLNTRAALLRQPTAAQILNPYGGSETLNAAWMSTAEQAEAMRRILAGLGVNAPVEDCPPQLTRFGIDYAGDPRRFFQIAGLNVGQLLERYAEYPKEIADQMTLKDLAGAS